MTTGIQPPAPHLFGFPHAQEQPSFIRSQKNYLSICAVPGVSAYNRYASVGKGDKTRGGGAVPWNAKAEVSTGLYPEYQRGGPREEVSAAPSLPVSPSISRLPVCPRVQGEPVTAVDG